jgi:hypothetical protein
MASQTTNEANKQPANNGGTAEPESEVNIKDRFKSKIETDRFMFNPNKGSTKPLVGYLINMIPMPEIAGRDWNAYVIKTTHPTIALNREQQAVKVPVGSEVLIPATYQLTQHLERAACNSKHCFEVYIEPLRKTEVGKGQTMWLYELRVDMTATKARSGFGPAAMLGSGASSGRGQSTAEVVGTSAADDDIPF